ncbi:hypothetical protein [Pseudoneobacillus sp. C159]
MLQPQEECSDRLESLLGSLIKMLGKTNERVDNLDRRIHQMEWAIRETYMATQETGGKSLYGVYSNSPNI